MDPKLLINNSSDITQNNNESKIPKNQQRKYKEV